MIGLPINDTNNSSFYIMKTYYRYDDSYDKEDIDLRIFKRDGDTDKGFWLKEIRFTYNRRWCSNKARRPYARETKEEAMESYIARKEAYLRILEKRILAQRDLYRLATGEGFKSSSSWLFSSY